jgi:murein DD-endopeptidase MepM/ murein hydrolase activator NlpD
VAKVGTSGRSTGPHLHFEVLRSGQQVDPVGYLEKNPQNHLASKARLRAISKS